ncbi:MAG: hypothetical protein KA143_06550 [Saprospiraceae bacterium]|nr:hypothetical protein [Saprospiraceae bacterium]
MRDRILNNWTFSRALYLLMGSFIILQSILSKQWIGGVIGIYFSAMGIFAFGCASGSCQGNSCETDRIK